MHFTQNHMVRRPVFASLLIFFIVCIAVSSASPQLPCEFYGPVTINGAPAPEGTVISAFVNNVKQGSIDVKEAGRFGGIGTFDERLIVLSGENDFTGGAPMITFKIGDKVADQTSQYAPGTSTELSLSVGGAPAVVTPAPANEQQPTLMSAASVAPVATPVPTVPVVTQTQVPAPVVPVVTSTPAPQNGVSILTVSTPVPTPVVQVNQTPAPQVQQNVTPTVTPAPVPPVVIPVVTAAPTPVSTPVVNVTATPAPTVIPTVVPTPVSNQTPANVTNVTPTSGNASVSVSFPSGQSVS